VKVAFVEAKKMKADEYLKVVGKAEVRLVHPLKKPLEFTAAVLIQLGTTLATRSPVNGATLKALGLSILDYINGSAPHTDGPYGDVRHRVLIGLVGDNAKIGVRCPVGGRFVWKAYGRGVGEIFVFMSNSGRWLYHQAFVGNKGMSSVAVMELRVVKENPFPDKRKYIDVPLEKDFELDRAPTDTHQSTKTMKSGKFHPDVDIRNHPPAHANGEQTVMG
jgi:hypothetical protein